MGVSKENFESSIFLGGLGAEETYPENVSILSLLEMG